ncbi:MAG: hypothetical protein EZS28_027311, partial [Streblomastix strix]
SNNLNEDEEIQKEWKRTKDEEGRLPKRMRMEDDLPNNQLPSPVPSPTNITKAPFRRVDPSKYQVKDERLADNRYEKKQGDDWGAIASQKLKPTRGKDFRSAKTKLKRGTYRGGEINQGVNSILLSEDD